MIFYRAKLLFFFGKDCTKYDRIDRPTMERICNALERWTNFVPSSVVLQLFYDEMKVQGGDAAAASDIQNEVIPTVVNAEIPDSGSLNQPLISYADTEDSFEETFNDTLSQSRNFVESLMKLKK